MIRFKDYLIIFMLQLNHNDERGMKMYLRILKKDLKRKKTMNVILLIFITMAATFIASSANNLFTISTALDSYFEKANVPDYWFATSDEKAIKSFETFAEDNDYFYSCTELLQIDPVNVNISGDQFEYGNSLCLSTVNGTKVFDRNSNELTQVNDGEIYVTAEIFNSDENNFYEGCKIVVEADGVKKEFTLKGYIKDALFGSAMMGMTRFLVSENDFKLFCSEQTDIMDSIGIYTDDTEFMDKFYNLDLQTIMNIDYSGIKRMYIMDMLIAAVVLIVSICLILISMVILHFTINFTMSEEFREIGVMKAIGITNNRIRELYIVKYLAISVIGASIGLVLSFPFSKLLIENASQNIIISSDSKFILNVACAVSTAVVVVLFCYFCTRKIRKFSPIDAIRSGKTGERYKNKGFIHLSKSKLSPVPFMAINDILSGPKRFFSMILIFTVGLLLIIIPVNTINTLKSDKLITMFNMADCDHVISQELLFSADGNNEQMISGRLDDVRKKLSENNIEADVFQEVMFRFSIAHGDKKMSSLAFQGKGEVTADMYSYLEGTPPQNNGEVAISYIVADNIGAEIGDDVDIQIGEEVKTYTVTAINQSMNNLGEGIRFYQDEQLDYNYAAGGFGIQIKYTDDPDSKTLIERKYLLKELYHDAKIYNAGEYIDYMIGDVAGQLEGVKKLILSIILCINILVVLLMVKSFIIKEKGEIAVLKAIGFKNSSLVAWQTIRIGIVLLISIVLGTCLSTPLSKLTVEPVFQMMGAYSIHFDIMPLGVYVFYPLIVLIVTELAAFISAQNLRKVSAAEASNIE